MSVERQQGGYYQRCFDFDSPTDSLRPDVCGDGGIEAATHEESQSLTALNQARDLTARLMEEVTDRKNLNRAYTLGLPPKVLLTYLIVTFSYNINGNRRIR